MTGRARCMLLMALGCVILGLIRRQDALALLGVTVLFWMMAEWVFFAWRVRSEWSGLQFDRRVHDCDSESGVLWAERTIDIVLSLRSSKGPMSGDVLFRDIIPEIATVRKPSPDRHAKTRRISKLEMFSNLYDIWLTIDPPRGPEVGVIQSRTNQAQITYQVHLNALGKCEFPGIHLTLQDPHHFFRLDRFVPLPQSFRVLPNYSEAKDNRCLVKRINTLPQHGVHRLQRSGMGSELLELREYVAGDPPKSIAWKVSARRDKLMTRQYESEVPIRLQLFVDGSPSVRTGGFGSRLIDQMSYVAASVARSAISVGDPVGLHLVDDRVQRIPAASGDRGFFQLLQQLSEFSIAKQPPCIRLTEALQASAMRVCLDRYPEWIDARYNQPPVWVLPIRFGWRKNLKRRFLLAGVLSQKYDLKDVDYSRLIHDDQPMAEMLGRFLHDSGWAWMEPMVDLTSLNRGGSEIRMQRLSLAIANAVAHAKDNEVFVILADMMESLAHLPVLKKSLQLAVARHHRVAFVCPTTTFLRPQKSSIAFDPDDLSTILRSAEQSRIRDRSGQLKRELGRMGISVSFSGEKNAIRMIQAETDMVREGRARLQGALR